MEKTIIQKKYLVKEKRNNGTPIKRDQQYKNVLIRNKLIKEKKRSILRLKRMMDVVGATCGLVPLSLMYPFIYATVKVYSPGPVFFKQERRGENGKAFMCFKFRTMHVDIKNHKRPENTPDITHKGDPRIFKFGEFMRRTNIDELPQLINVLKGEMSLVGPRPLMVEECDYWSVRIPDFDLRHSLKPGLTGWAQITGYRGGNLSEKHMSGRLKRDLKYIDVFSTRLDIKIIYRTLVQMARFDTKAH